MVSLCSGPLPLCMSLHDLARLGPEHDPFQVLTDIYLSSVHTMKQQGQTPPLSADLGGVELRRRLMEFFLEGTGIVKTPLTLPVQRNDMVLAWVCLAVVPVSVLNHIGWVIQLRESAVQTPTKVDDS